MDWNDLRYLLAVHRKGSLARAAIRGGKEDGDSVDVELLPPGPRVPGRRPRTG